MMLVSQAHGLPVITADEAEELGRVSGLTIDPHTRSVVCVRLSGAPKHATGIAWDLIEGMGRSAVVVRSPASTGSGRDDFPTHHEILGKRVLTEHGTAHGTVKDVAFDTTTGHLQTLYTALGEISGNHLLGIGEYAVVVRGA
ncbi:PRC-barrel domain-containing protein [Streptomyces sp. NEAU-sy36]|uniref:PRC-barrel domain-containing protein n=1 Tax=unclassified Streptomyces TaxID=2593676 RepID=UPI0015D61B4E|nr:MULTISPECIES: PRC-barrel domain-containing protein [unclassified Streptomyces]QLJ03017.1 PRC-barrel domain-containing protein [Streptomyces sp. NEAU-sy36]